MKLLTFLFFLIFIFSNNLYAQNKTEFSSELYQIYLTDGKLSVVENKDGGIEIFTKQFLNPSAYTIDIDRDGVDEFFLIDNIKFENYPEYLLYIYNLLDSFYLASEINSGILEPYHTTSGEIEGLIIVAGNSDFSYLNDGNEVKSLPINCWKYEDGEIFSVNEELYEIFITENENLLAALELEEINNCDKSKQFKPFIAYIYINYLNAGERVTADNFLGTFYKCEDLKNFKDELENHYNKGNNEI